MCTIILIFFFFNDTATTEIYTLSLHDALPISNQTINKHLLSLGSSPHLEELCQRSSTKGRILRFVHCQSQNYNLDRKSTRLNSSHANISYAVFCLKKKKNSHINHDYYTIRNQR